MKVLPIILLLSLTILSQEILETGKNYKFDKTMVLFTVEQFNKLEAAWSDDSLNIEKIKLLQNKIEIMEQLEKELNDNIFLLERKNTLQKDKLDLSIDRDSLVNKKVLIYKDLYEETDKELKKRMGKSGFFNNTFWFGIGTVIGIGLTYLGSEIVSNVN